MEDTNLGNTDAGTLSRFIFVEHTLKGKVQNQNQSVAECNHDSKDGEYDSRICDQNFKVQNQNQSVAECNHDSKDGEYDSRICDQNFKVQKQNQSVAECNHDSKDGEYDSRICDQNFNCRTDSDHPVINASKCRYRCEECGKGFRYKTFLCKHLEKVHDKSMGKQHQHYRFGRKVSCVKPRRSPLRMNKKERSGFSCALCGEIFSRQFDRNHHRCCLLSTDILQNGPDSKCRKWRNGKAEAYVCPICNRTFRMKESWKRHMVVHCGQEKYECPVCSRKFISTRDVRRHIMANHTTYWLQGGYSNWDLRICKKTPGKSGPERKNLRDDGEKRSHCNCALCGALFSCWFDRNRHRCDLLSSDILQTHSGSKLKNGKATAYLCPICNKTFKLKSWKRHMNVHLGQQKYKCPVCSRKFTYPADVRRHIRGSHTTYWLQGDHSNWDFRICKKTQHNSGLERKHKEKKNLFNCALCGATFSCRFDRNHHRCNLLSSEILQTHSGSRWENGKAKAYLCPICNKTYDIVRSWKRHMVVHLGQQKYKCPMCRRKFTCSTDARRHLVMSHKQKEMSQHHVQKYLLLNSLPSEMVLAENLRKDDADSNGDGWIPVKEKPCKIQLLNNNEDIAVETPRKKMSEFLCEECGRKFKYRRSYQKHMMNMHNKKHKKSHHGVKFSDSKYVGFHLKTQMMLESVQDKLEAKHKYLCSVCGKSYEFRPNLDNHQIAPTDSHPYMCSLCHERLSCKVNLTYHTRECLLSTFTSSTAMPKNAVNSNFDSRTEMEKSHPPEFLSISGIEENLHKDPWMNENQGSAENTEPNVKRSRCERQECRKYSKYKVKIQEQTKNVHSSGDSCGEEDSFQGPFDSTKTTPAPLFREKHQCTVSSKQHSTGQDLSRHNWDSSFRCKWCPEKRNTKSELDAHESIHKTGHQCHICGISYPFLLALLNHMSDHACTHPYSCSQCGRRFRFDVALQNHHKEHLSLGVLHDDLSYEYKFMYQCALCGRRFSELYDLGKHRDMHLTEEPFKNSTNEDRVSSDETPQSQCHFDSQGNCDTVMPDLQSVEEGYKLLEVHTLGEDSVDGQRLHDDRVMPDLTLYSIEENDNFPDMYAQDVEECKDNFDSEVLVKTADLSRQIGKEEYQCMLCDKKFNADDELKAHLETDCM